MNEKRNLGRGLGDMMNEVSTVRAMPVQPAANLTEALAAARSNISIAPTDEQSAAETQVQEAAVVQPELPAAAPATVEVAAEPIAPEQTAAERARDENESAKTIVVEEGTQLAPAIIEERPADADLQQRPAERVVEKIVKLPFVPLWAKLAVAVLAGIIVVLIVTLTQFHANIGKLESQASSLSVEVQTLHAELARDPLVWTERIQIPGVRVERFGKNARVLFEFPFFTSDTKWSETTEKTLAALLREIAPHASECMVTIVGHTARQPLPRGSLYKDNYDLGLKRAQAVVEVMVRSVKWPLAGVSVRSDGDRYPPYRGDDVLSQVRNRTITLEIRPQ